MSTHASNLEPLSRFVVVLYEPQDDINIGNTVRACKNFGITRIRLIRPAVADAHRIAISAPKAGDVIEAIERFDDHDQALADCTWVVGLTARSRRTNWVVQEPFEASRELVRRVQSGESVALMFGREDSGLPNEMLERCHALVTIPTNPGYTSLNLGQAVLLMVWEVFSRLHAGTEPERAEAHARPAPPAVVPARKVYGPAPMAQLETMFQRMEEGLHAIEFFKSDTSAHIMRSLRAIVLRTGLDTREAALLMSIFGEIPAFLKRRDQQSKADRDA